MARKSVGRKETRKIKQRVDRYMARRAARDLHLRREIGSHKKATIPTRRTITNTSEMPSRPATAYGYVSGRIERPTGPYLGFGSPNRRYRKMPIKRR